jgi:hypothetical protein
MGTPRTLRKAAKANGCFGGVVCASARSKPRRLGDGGCRLTNNLFGGGLCAW